MTLIRYRRAEPGCRAGPLASVLALVLVLLLLPAPAPAARSVPTDRDISEAVEDGMLIDPVIASYLVNVKTTDGIVSLSGSVPDLLARVRAERLASSVRGVRGVVNRLEVLPRTVQSDDELRHDVESALFSDPASDAYEVAVSVDRGVVTLTGTVDSWQEQQHSAHVAMGVDGVLEVRNNLTVSPAEKRPDSEILQDVKSALHWDRLVDDDELQVSVSGGVVTISGSVGSLAERSRALVDAWVSGVRNVDVDGVEIAAWADDKKREARFPDMSDEEIESAVLDALAVDPRVLSFHVEPEVTDGLVTLRGEVDNLKAKQSAEADARRTLGVWGVRNRLKIVSDRPDADIARDVREAVKRDAWTAHHSIDVSVDSGVATLTGEVDGNYERLRADDIASRVTGVRRVDNQLEVDRFTRIYYEPYLEDWNPRTTTWYRAPAMEPRASDFEIASNIRNRLYWSPLVDEDDIQVLVLDGVAILTGVVDDPIELLVIRSKAFQGGAVAVRSEIRIEDSTS